MTSFLIAGLCLALSALLVRGLELWIGSGRAKQHDLTPSGQAVDSEWVEYVDQVTRERNNALSVSAYEKRRDALGLGAVREVRS